MGSTVRDAVSYSKQKAMQNNFDYEKLLGERNSFLYNV